MNTPDPKAIKVFIANCVCCTLSDKAVCNECPFKAGLRVRNLHARVKVCGDDSVKIERLLENIPHTLYDLYMDNTGTSVRDPDLDYPSYHNPYKLEWQTAEAMAAQFSVV